MPAPTLAKPATPTTSGQQGSGGAPAQVAAPIPFMRAARQKSRAISTIGPVTLTGAVTTLQSIALPTVGFLARVRLSVVGTTSGNAATVAFNNDGPFNVLQQISFVDASSDTLIGVIDGFVLYCINKYFAMATDTGDPLTDPGYSVTVGAVGTGGSFAFQLDIPIEIDKRDGLGLLQNMAATQAYQLQMSLNSTTGLYTTAPTTAPTVTITSVMEYYSQPAAQTPGGATQATFPDPNGSIGLIQTQTPPITPGTQMTSQLLQIGNVIRSQMFILRNSSGVRTETDWPNVFNYYVNTDPWFYKLKAIWRKDMARQFNYTNGITATPTKGALDNGVFVITDFYDQGSAGADQVQSTSDRNRLLVTGSQTGLNIEGISWGANASTLQVVQLAIRPSDAAALYSPIGVY